MVTGWCDETVKIDLISLEMAMVWHSLTWLQASAAFQTYVQNTYMRIENNDQNINFASWMVDKVHLSKK